MAPGRPARHQHPGLDLSGQPPGTDVTVSEPGADLLQVDGGTLECVALLLLLRRHVETAAPGTLILLSTQDPIAQIDLPAWCRLTGHTWLGPHPHPHPEPRHSTGPRLGQDQPPGRTRFVYGVRVEAHAQTTHPQRPWRVIPPTPDDEPARHPNGPAPGRPTPEEGQP